jgi:hypothetical protein
MRKLILVLVMVLTFSVSNAQSKKWKYLIGFTYELTEDNQFIAYQKGEEISRVKLTMVTDTGYIKAYKEEDDLYERMYKFIDSKKRTLIQITIIDKFSKEVSHMALDLKKIK